MADTANDAIGAIPDVKPVESPKPDEAAEVKKALNTTQILLGIAGAVILILGTYTTVAVRAAQTETRSIETAAKVETLQNAVNRIPVIETQMGAMKDTTIRIEGDVKDVKRLLEARK